MLGSKFMDIVLGIDRHIEIVPTPAGPVPTPMPNVFFGVIFDPAQLASLALADCPAVAVVAMALDPIGAVVNIAADAIEGTGGGLVLINGVPATNTMTTVSNRYGIPHIVIPPGTMFVVSGKPMHIGDAVYNLGSSSVWFSGRRAVRTLIDPAFTCSEPVRLPTGITMPVPLGAPVVIGGWPMPDLQAMVSRTIRNAVTGRIKKAISKPLGKLVGRIPNQRLRQLLATYKCFVTGDPVDVATGRMFTSATDFDLPGPMPLTFEREYSSAVSDRDGVLGHGWCHSLDEEAWIERGRVVYRGGDGREIQFDTIDLPGRQIRVGDSLYEPVNRLWLSCVQDGFDVTTAQGEVHQLRPVQGDRWAGRFRLSRILSRDGHAIEIDYDERACLEWVRDSEGRVLRFEHDQQGRLAQVWLPHPSAPGFVPHVRYEYSPDGNLLAVHDALGNTERYEYSGHLMVRRTDRTGLSFYFGYDGLDASACCVRTWGDGGIYDHELVYDKERRKTVVTNSLGAMTLYEMNEALFVVKVTDAQGGVMELAYDDQLRQVREVEPSGEVTEWEYDARGNCVRVVEPGGFARRMAFDQRDQCISVVDSLGAEHALAYDNYGRVVTLVDPLGQVTTLDYERGRLSYLRTPDGRETRLAYDSERRLETVTLSNGATMTRQFDALGRLLEARDARGGVRRFAYTALGDVTAVMDPLGLVSEYRYDGERNLVEARDPSRQLRLTYSGFHRVAAREEAGTRVTFAYDTEQRLTAIVNEAGERHEFELDVLGNVHKETGFDGSTRTYLRDKSGRVTETLHPSGRSSKGVYDVAGRLVEVTHSDGTFAKFQYDGFGRLVEAVNESSHVKLERDRLGRVVRESQDGGQTWVRSAYGSAGDRTRLESDLGAYQAIELDALGDVVALAHGSRQPAAGRLRFQRDVAGLETARELAGGIRVEWALDAEGRPSERRTTRHAPGEDAVSSSQRGSWAPLWRAAGDVESLDARSYLWRGRDQLDAVVSASTGPTFYDHDARGRLVRERRPAEQRVVERAMDVVGNVYRSADGSDRRYGKGGRIEHADGIQYEHDADGNLLKRLEVDGQAWLYRWNGHGLLAEVERPDGTRVRLEYDALGRRTKKAVVAVSGGAAAAKETRFVWDGDTVLHELDAKKPPTTWYWEPGTFTPVMKEQASKRWCIASDHLGTPIEMYDELGEIAWKMQLDTVGVPSFEIGKAEDCPWRWPGQYDDPELELAYNRWRYFSRHIVGFISDDPLGIQGGMRLCAYPADPSMWIDPLGLTEWFIRYVSEEEAKQSASNLKGDDNLHPRPHGNTTGRGPKWISEEQGEHRLASQGPWRLRIAAKDGTTAWLRSLGVNFDDLANEKAAPKRVINKSNERGSHGVGVDLLAQLNDNITKITATAVDNGKNKGKNKKKGGC
ncbi:DUF6531 domain-containing protein [Pendulispora rubella]|uniref:DUF6531 domain-containing protein n=1 Tax=Pendulispora rubella TaxID=2741070 RepID=A0ABZ2L4C9_9BACT